MITKIVEITELDPWGEEKITYEVKKRFLKYFWITARCRSWYRLTYQNPILNRAGWIFRSLKEAEEYRNDFILNPFNEWYKGDHLIKAKGRHDIYFNLSHSYRSGLSDKFYYDSEYHLHELKKRIDIRKTKKKTRDIFNTRDKIKMFLT